MRPRTSLTHPLQVAEVAAPGGGTVGVTFCPGKHQADAATGAWARDLGTDLDALAAWGARAVLTLVTPEELRALRVEALGAEVRARGMDWLHLPLPDVTAPGPDWEARWSRERARLHRILDAGGRVVVHCKGGLGRAGTAAALLLAERGVPPDTAIAAVRRVRPGALETRSQEEAVRRPRTPWQGDPAP
jgi:protein-tyrosine phosphatase